MQLLVILIIALSMRKHKPYKKSIRAAGSLELSFISPMIGEKCGDKLKEIAEVTGWDISIARTVNHNQVTNIAAMLCNSAGLVLKKNPSFNPSNYEVTLKLENIDEEELAKIKLEFEKTTGCLLAWS